MRTYIIGVGQCGTSIALDLISSVTNFTKSKEINSRPQEHGSTAATNELLGRLRSDYAKPKWTRRFLDTVNQLFGLDGDVKGGLLVDPELALIDGNQENYVKNAFSVFKKDLTSPVEEVTRLQRYLVELILGTRVLDLKGWNRGCVYGTIGEAVVKEALPIRDLRSALEIDDGGRLSARGQGDDGLARVRIFFVVASAGGGTGSGGSSWLGSGAILEKSDATQGSLVANLIVLPSFEASALNPRYALNAGRLLARASAIMYEKGGANAKPFSSVLFSNPNNEGDFQKLQVLNNYIVEFILRCANFSYVGNVARAARDLDPQELISFMDGKSVVIGMSHLDVSQWSSSDLWSELVGPAFVDLFSETGDGVDQKPRGLSVERSLPSEKGDDCDVLAHSTAALVVLGIPPKFGVAVDVPRIASLILELSGSSMRGGVFAYSYGSLADLEITVMLRFPAVRKNPLAAHFIRRYACKEPTYKGGERAKPLLEATYVQRVAKSEDEDAEEFESISGLLGALDGLGGFVLDRRRARE